MIQYGNYKRGLGKLKSIIKHFKEAWKDYKEMQEAFDWLATLPSPSVYREKPTGRDNDKKRGNKEKSNG